MNINYVFIRYHHVKSGNIILLFGIIGLVLLREGRMDLRSLALFVRIAEIGRIGQAGESLGLSTTNASQRVQQLESQLKVKLLHRSTRTVTLTHDGQLFLEHAKRILDDVEEAQNAFRDDGIQVKGKIRMTVSSSYARIYIIPFLPEFLSLYPEVEIDIDFTDKTTDLVEQGYDLAFRIGDLKSNSLLARRIADNPCVLVAAPEYLARCGSPKIPEDLLEHTCLPFGSERIWSFRHPSGRVITVPVGGRMSLNWGDAISDLIEVGMGVGYASLWHAGPSIHSGRVIPILTDYELWPQTRIWAVRPPGRVTPTRIKVFLDYIESKIVETNQQRYGNLAPLQVP